jgi:hypothetical protein
MPALKTLSFAPLPKTANDSVSLRRAKLISRLEEQQKLIHEPNLVRTIQRTVKENGEKRIVTKELRVRPWWRIDGAGHVFMTIKHGGKPLEFEKGKSGIAVASKEKLPAVIETLIAAVRAGELDDILAQASKTRPFQKKKAA